MVYDTLYKEIVGLPDDKLKKVIFKRGFFMENGK